MKSIEQWILDYISTSASKYIDLYFVYERKVYMVTLHETYFVKSDMLKIDHDSTTGEDTLRLSIKKIRKAAILNNFPCKYIGEESILPRKKSNVGDWCEEYEFEQNGQVWRKSSVPYYKEGDIKIGGVWHQIKFENGTFAKLKTIEKALTLKG